MKIIGVIINVSFFATAASAIWGAISRFGFTPLGIGLAAMVCFIAAFLVGVVVELEKREAAKKKEKEWLS